MIRDDATQAQVTAARPDASTWLSANAGSGKTRVLTDRVARLLLDETPPQRILCLTYTKAAASEMQNRLFERLGEWAMMPDNKLRKALDELGIERAVDDETLRRARRLFARAIETPGGLKIQTIHSFCAALLRRFPLEAGVSPQFVEMDDRSARRLREEVLETLADQENPETFDGLVRYASGDDLSGLISEITKHRAEFSSQADAAMIWDRFGLPAGFDENDLLAKVYLGGETELIRYLCAGLEQGSSTDAKAAAKLQAFQGPTRDMLPLLEGVFLFGAKSKAPFGAKVDSFPTKATRDALADLMPRLNALMLRVEDARAQRLALAAAERTHALHRFAQDFLPEYEHRKQLRGWLDFDDLILKSRDLLTDPGVAQWVLFRLDGGLDHILVDEAQDTSPLQWQVIDLLAQEFTSGIGARDDTQRTIFVVGDKKQSIYSFQGADPDGFDRMKDHFGTKLLQVDQTLADRQLEYSFRSAAPILQLVDETFTNASGMGDTVHHKAFQSEMPGRVDLWPAIAKTDKPEKPDWTDPVDILSPEHHAVQLAETVAAEIAAMLDSDQTLWTQKGRRKISAGDVLILVQRRSDLFHEIIRACKAAKLPIAGADRLKIGGELAVRDLTALLAFLSLPEDSLSLASVLKSPLFNWDEARLYDLAAGRTQKHLWPCLRDGSDEATKEVLFDLLAHADFLRPFDLLERILTRHKGREKLIARLGPEAEDGIDALLSQALTYEQAEVPSLTGFLGWLETDEVEIKREQGSAGDQIRVMTVHGAKGLEAPIVILPDTARRDIRIRENIFVDETPMWAPTSDESPSQITAQREAARARQEEERQRLLYVAMTRAEQWLIVCAAGETGKGNSWYDQIAAAMARTETVPLNTDLGPGLRLESGDWGKEATLGQAPESRGETTLPGWAKATATKSGASKSTFSPSDLGGAKAMPGEHAGWDEEASKARGLALHLLLEHLPNYPRERWEEIADHLLPDPGELAYSADIEPVFDEAMRVLSNPDLAQVFADTTLAEVPLTAPVPGFDRPFYGIIDRLIPSDGRILAVDFKSNLLVPTKPEDTPEGVLRQLGAYEAMLSAIYPGLTVETAVLWTRTATLMPIPRALITEALARAALDGDAGGS
ncbi:double-strand break repair helicase AddA [Actibacterium pelagium]|uniref:DNA 3'-5' helicase n=1 Tax=Actibacterium pelagium TaxID=2029103 RepID=A0A917AJ46_9RHOB|nr:double-strand break repair helicase AddA [Actibacterium pelagium]GGE55635.1 double-strand break repair helicase AddA [Actibacterium pelagium]